MQRHILVLPNGQEIGSGADSGWAIQSVKLTQQVNDGRELTPGSVCAAMAEVKILDTGNTLSIAAGEEVKLYTLAGEGERTLLGIFRAEKPTRPSSHICAVTGYDRVSCLDKDLSQWLSSLTGWPYRMEVLVNMVCQACGVELTPGSIPNGELLVAAFTGQGITGRQILRWAAQAAGRFCRATAEGKLEFAWYRHLSDRCIGPREGEKFGIEVQVEADSLTLSGPELTAWEEDGHLTLSGQGLGSQEDGFGNLLLTVSPGVRQHYYYLGSLRREDYRTARVDAVHIRKTSQDVGAVYPDLPWECNTMTLTGNYLLRGLDAAALEQVAESLYQQMYPVVYTPMQVTVAAESGIWAGDIVTVTDPQDREMTLYVMSATRSGGKVTLEATGSPRRDSSGAVNEVSYQALSGKVLELQMDVDGLRLENRDAQGQYAAITMDVAGIGAQVAQNQTDLNGIRQQVSTLEQTAQGLTFQVQTVVSDGVSQVVTRQKRYTLDDRGLQISGGRGMENLLDETGMTVSRSGQVMLQANDAGVTAADVKVHNYLIVGKHARFEDYADSAGSRRTACFFMEGD